MDRRRHVLALFGTAALMNLVMATVSPVATIAAADALGPAWGGVPNTAAVVGTGVGAILLSRTAAWRGWRFTLAARVHRGNRPRGVRCGRAGQR